MFRDISMILMLVARLPLCTQQHFFSGVWSRTGSEVEMQGCVLVAPGTSLHPLWKIEMCIRVQEIPIS